MKKIIIVVAGNLFSPVFFIIMLLINDISFASKSGAVVMYEHSNFKGKSFTVEPNQNYSNVGEYWNDRISSIKVPNGCELSVYQDSSFGGKSKIFKPGQYPNIGNSWNDQISSLKTLEIDLDDRTELKILNVTIDPKPGLLSGNRIILNMHRTYSFRVGFELMSGGKLMSSAQRFTVRTDCIRNGKKIKLGDEHYRIEAGTASFSSDFVYDVFPGEAGGGDCLIRTMIDVNNEVNEPDESPISNIWDRQATILP